MHLSDLKAKHVSELVDLANAMEIDGASGVPDTIGLADRVGAAGGSLTVDLTRPETVRLHVELPCE